MRYYWQTKYTTLIYIPFFIFPPNRHFFVHISPSVLEVWKCPCGRTPFQPSEDTNALLSDLPPLSHNVVHAADPSIISCTALCPIPSVRAIVSTVTRLSSWMISSILSLLRSVEAVRGRPPRDSSWMLVFPSLKCFTYLRTLLAPMHTLP